MIQHLRSTFLFCLLMAASPTFAQSVASILDAAPNQEVFWSVTVRNAEGNLLEGFNSENLIIPASNQKLYTTAAILDGLGSDFRYTTNIYRTGEIVDSVLYGDLIIRGVGDPSISGFLYGEDRLYVFNHLAGQLKGSGIAKVSGSLIANIGYFTGQKYPKGWDWDDLSFYYGVEIAPLSFNNNAVDLVVNANGEIGRKPEISWFPFNTDYVEFFNRQIITKPNTKYDENYLKYLGANKFHLGSFLPQGYLEEESLAISDAHLYFLDSFEKLLNQSGIETSGRLETQNSDTAGNWNTYPIVAKHISEPLGILVEWANKESDNFYTEMMLRTLAAKTLGTPADFESGIRLVRAFLGSLELDTTYVIMKDGSGMASGNFTKTSILSEFLVKMQQHPEFETFLRSMSVAGIDGTIAYRMKGTPMYNNFKGKSGYMSGVRTLSGYLKTKTGDRIIVSMAANNFGGKVSPIDAIHEEILMYLYEKY